MKDASPGFFPPIPFADDPSKPMYVQLYDWFRSAIISGGLRPGQKVPSSRQLASELKVSRITVLTAFQQLHAEGYLEGSVDSGTYVAKSIPDHAVKLTLGDALRRLPSDSHHGPRRVSKLGTKFLSAPLIPRGFRAFQVGLPALDRFPRTIWSRLLIRHSRQTKKELMAYGNPMGRSACREAAGARLIPVRVDQEGLDVNRGIKRRPDARVAVVTPSHQFPLGMTMSATRRVLLLDWATRNGFWIVEDDYDNEFRFGIRPIASLQGLDKDERVIYVGTFSKVLFPSLRIGYLIIPNDLIPAFSRVRETSDIFPRPYIMKY
jgi:GntR family transcriptional regulator / MocR family aminotransferase